MKAKAAPKRNDLLTTSLGGVFGFVLAYAFISRAFSTGSYWQYLGFFVFMILGFRLIVRSFKIRNGKARATR